MKEIKEITTIKLSRKTVEVLNTLKIHPRQAYEEVVLKLIAGHKAGVRPSGEIAAGKREITTIKLSKRTVEILNSLKVHPRQAYEEVVLALIAEKHDNG